MILSVSSDQQEILWNIRQLYLNGERFHVDMTYGKGGFWKSKCPPLDWPVKFKSDGADLPGLSLRADFTQMPFLDNSIRSLVLDPPFLHAVGKDSQHKHFGMYPRQKNLQDAYSLAIYEARRVLVPGGILVFKCQDVIQSSKQVMNHIHVWGRATAEVITLEWLSHDLNAALPMECLDLFVLARGRPPIVGWNQHVQQHSRKVHSYFWVFRKPVSRQRLTRGAV